LFSGFVLDDTNKLCYKVIDNLNHYEAAENACEGIDAEMVQFENDNQVQAFVNLLKTGLKSFYNTYNKLTTTVFNSGLKFTKLLQQIRKIFCNFGP